MLDLIVSNAARAAIPQPGYFAGIDTPPKYYLLTIKFNAL